METNKFLQKCGEILIDKRSKNKKNKIYTFQCTFCDTQCDQLKKFSIHIGEEHLNDFDEILKEAQNSNETNISKETDFLTETELKLEAEPEEFKLTSFNDIEETPDIKVFQSPLETKININPDPLDTVTAASSSANVENLNCEVKYEIIEHEGETAGDMEVVDGTVSISDSDKSDSDEDYIEEVPHKKRKTNKLAKKGKPRKRKENSNDTESDESKDAICNNMVARQSLTREERLEKKRAAERLRYQRIKNDPEKYALLKAKEHMKYEKKKEKGKIKTVNQMSAEEKEHARQLWREKTRRQRLRRYAKFKLKLENNSTSDNCYSNNDTSLLCLAASTLNNQTFFQNNSPLKNADKQALFPNDIKNSNSSHHNMSSLTDTPRGTSLNNLTAHASSYDKAYRNTSLNTETKKTSWFDNATADVSRNNKTSVSCSANDNIS